METTAIGNFIYSDSRTNVGGTGLGLYVAKNFVELHGGRIWAESDGEGKGSRFFVELGARQSPSCS